MEKNEVYSWRIARATRAGLEEAARRRGVPMAALLDEMARGWLEEQLAADGDDEAEQERLRAAAARTIGTIRGGNPRRSERARDTIRRKLARDHGR